MQGFKDYCSEKLGKGEELDLQTAETYEAMLNPPKEVLASYATGILGQGEFSSKKSSSRKIDTLSELITD
jgi:hypothetical protein